MQKILVLLVFLVSCIVRAETDPCESNQYSVKLKSNLSHPESFELPAIFYKTNNSKIIVSVSKAINFVEKNIPSPKEQGKVKDYVILTVDAGEESAVVKVKSEYINIMFIDTLSFRKIDNNWKIYNKVFEGIN